MTISHKLPLKILLALAQLKKSRTLRHDSKKKGAKL